MSDIFLTARWRHLLMANYAIDAAVLKPHLPRFTELDHFDGTYYVSLVGFLFQDVRLLRMAIPFHTTFEEVNLRFYVRYKDGTEWKRGVVFLKEIVPKHAITFVANAFYKENYATHKMKHSCVTGSKELRVSYEWQVGQEWNCLAAVAASKAMPISPYSLEEFITEHYWGYTFITENRTGQYQVAHPKWNIHAVKSYDIKCNAAQLYGAPFATALAEAPRSVFLADGSAIQVYKGTKLTRTLDA